jgi:type VI secretion system protein ImpF
MRFPADVPERDRLQPALLDRLIDEDPRSHVEPPHRRVVDETRLREALRRDLTWLFGTANSSADPGPGRVIATDPDLRSSVLNFGIPDLVGRAASTFDRAAVLDLERALRQAIADFEPRLRRQTVRVLRRDPTADEPDRATASDGHRLRFHIEGELLAFPVQARLLLQAVVDVENGTAEIAPAASRGP